MSARAAYAGASWIALAFAASFALGALPALAALPLAAVAAPAEARVAFGVVALALTSAVRVAILVAGVRRAGRASERPPWVGVVLAGVCAVFAYPISVGASIVSSAVAARELGPEGLAALAVSGSVLSLIGGALDVLLLVGVLVALALRWQRALDADDRPTARGADDSPP
ncbi:MAG: hypothetical protein KF729_34335 [Sandaracinaceae bacterium]|nr:hypothetical protein [Sandaracinaceae bacterium]